MTFLRIKSEESYLSKNLISIEGDSLTVNLTTTCPTNSTITIFTGSTIGDNYASSWTASQSFEIEAGEVTNDYVVVCPGMRYGNICLTGTDSNGPYEDWLGVFSLLPNPRISANVDSVSYTNATILASVPDFGALAILGQYYIEVSQNEDYSNPVISGAVGDVCSDVPSTLSFSANALLTDTTYFARVSFTNNLGYGASAELSLTTMNPTVATLSLLHSNSGFNYGSFLWNLEDYGDDSTSAQLYLDVSTSVDFTSPLVNEITNVVGVLPATASYTVTELTNSMTYYARARAVNTWGLTSCSEPVVFKTTDKPFKISGISSLSLGNSNQVSINLNEIINGATLDLRLYLNGRLLNTYSGVTAPREFFETIVLPSGSGLLKVTAQCFYNDRTYEYEQSQQINTTSGVISISTISNITDRLVFVGDTISLPALTDTESYAVMNDGIANLNGNSIMTHDAGFTLLRHVDIKGITNEYRFGVVPRQIGNGDVFFRKVDSTWTSWVTDTGWTNLTRNTSRRYPDAPDDVAAILGTVMWWTHYIPAGRIISVAGIVVCSADGNNANVLRENGSGCGVRFSRTDGGNGFYKFSQTKSVFNPDGSWNNNLTTLRLGLVDNPARSLTYSFTTPELEIDFVGGSETNAWPRKAISLVSVATIFEIGSGQVLRFMNKDKRTSDNVSFSNGKLTALNGNGTIVNEDSTVSFTGVSTLFTNFTGLVSEESYTKGSTTFFTFPSNCVISAIGGWYTKNNSDYRCKQFEHKHW